MSFYSVIHSGYADTSSAKSLSNQFSEYCDWCWGSGYGSCSKCRKEYMKLYIPLRIAEKQKELGLPQTR